MTLGLEVAGGWNSTAKKGDSVASLGAVSLGLASVFLATGAGAQEATQDGASLPPIEVPVKKASSKPKKKSATKRKNSEPVQASAPAVAPAPASEPSDKPAGDPQGSAYTPESGNTLATGTGLGRLQGSLQNTPQTANVISQKQMKEQNITTLDQALRSVPGVTVNVGEGGGGMNGDQFRIRGFQAKGDIYVDGLRDFGVYVRDSFAYEEVQVLKGPSSESFGMGTGGGAINNRQKTAHLGDASSIEATIGTDDYYRSVIDINKQIDATTAMRTVGMWHDQNFADRDHLYSERWGFLGSLAFGIGTDTTLTVNYLHQEGERLPDFGVPIIDADGASGPIVGRPVTEYGVPRSNFYGKQTDIDDYNVDMLTARLSKKVNDGLTIYNDTRLAFYGRNFAQTVPSCNDNNGANCLTSVLDGTFAGTYSLGGPAGFDQDSWGAQNVTTAVAKFKTAGLRHEFTAGLDVYYQNDERTQLGVYDANGDLQSGTGGTVKDPGTIGDPNFWNTTGYSVRKNPLALKQAEATNVALFASDRVWLTQQFSVLGGLRWDKYSAEYQATDPTTGSWTGGTAADVDTDTDFFSPKASVIWEPTKNQNYYASWAKSSSPIGQFITNDNSSVSTTLGQNNQDPEENELWEVGAKYTTLGGRLGLTAALFRVEKGNASYADPTNPGDTVVTGEKQRVQGVELGMTGKLTDAWSVQAAYAYFDSEILYSPETESRNGDITPENANKGNRVSFVPKNAISLWTTYELSQLINMGPGILLVGAGVTYSDDYFVNSGNTSAVPSNFTFDGLVSYEIDDWKFAVNGYNLSDELNYDAAIGNRAVVSPGRTVLLTIGKKF